MIILYYIKINIDMFQFLKNKKNKVLKSLASIATPSTGKISPVSI